MRPLEFAIFQEGSVELAFIERGVCQHGDWQFFSWKKYARAAPQ